MLAHVEVLVDHRRLGPMSFEDAVILSHELVREGIPLWRIRLVHARHPHRPRLPRVAPDDGAGLDY
jgi:hypothetical protein